MKTKNEPLGNEELTLSKLALKYADEDEARKLMESLRWPHGPICPHCESPKPYVITPKTTSRSPARKGLYKCRTCWRQFTVMVGTIFSDSKIPLSKWSMAIFLLCSSKKAISTHQLHRMLGVTYKTAWFMSHRIRHAMKPNKRRLSGIVEVDETFFGKKSDVKRSKSSKSCVAALVERGGEVRTQVVASVTSKNMGKCVRELVDRRPFFSWFALLRGRKWCAARR
jgi:transposase-like protein